MYVVKRFAIITFCIIAIVLLIRILPLQNTVTGATTANTEESKTYILDKEFNESTAVTLDIKNTNSIKLNGEWNGIGGARAYADINGTLSLILDTAKLQQNQTKFVDKCEETCNLAIQDTNLILVLRDNATLKISHITYTQQKLPGKILQTTQLPDITITDNTIVNLSQFFTETNNALITYAITPITGIRTIIFEDKLHLFPRETGNFTARIITTNGAQMLTSNAFSIFVTQEPQSKIENEVEKKLETEEEVSVIIQLNDTRKDEFRTKYSTKKSNADKSYDYEPNKNYENFQILAVKLTKQGLQKLKNDTTIKTVHLDKNLTISLTESIQLIRANLAQELNYLHTQILGQGQTLCILDTGIDANHKAFEGRILQGKNFIANNNDTNDDNGHGTHVAGMAAANGTVFGIAPRANILPIKVCDANGNCPTSAILAGIDYCLNNTAQNNISVISGSFADNGEYNSTNCPTYLEPALLAANEQNITNTFAAGNNHFQNGTSYPACSPFAISVGASTKQDTLALFSNKGETIDILAPGEDITSTLPQNNYGAKSGTSMSTAFVSGTVALIAQKQRLQNFTLSPTQIEQLLKETAEKSIEGIPRIDSYNAVSRAGETKINASPPTFTSTEIIFKQPIDWTNFSTCSNLSFNHAEIFSDKCPEYNKPARIVLKGLQWVEAKALRDGIECEGISCFNTTYSYGTLTSDVLNFGSYSATGTGEIILEQQINTPGLPTDEPPFFYGKGENGSLIIAAGTTVILNTSTTGANPSRKGGYNFTDLVVQAGGVLTIVPEAASAPLLIRVIGDVNISGNISIGGRDGALGAVAGGLGGPNGSIGGSGGAENGLGTDGGGPGGGIRAAVLADTGGGSGAGHATAGGASISVAGNNSAAGGVSYNNGDITSPDIDGIAVTVATGGSGGGGGSGGATGGGTRSGGSGGGGGGAIKIIAGGTINISGIINATGGNGGASNHANGGCGGGGSGGTIILAAPRIILSGVLNVSGGKGSATTCYGGAAATQNGTGGNGSAGRIKLHYENLTIDEGALGRGQLDLTGNGSAANAVGGIGTNVSYPFIGCGSDIVGDVNLSFNSPTSSTRNITCKLNSTIPYILRLQKRNITTTNPGIASPYTVNCLGVNITGNSTRATGGGIGIIINTSNVVLKNCNIQNLTTGLLIGNQSANNTFSNLNFSNTTTAINISYNLYNFSSRDIFENIAISFSNTSIELRNLTNATFSFITITSSAQGIVAYNILNVSFHNLTLGSFGASLNGTTLKLINSSGVLFNNSLIGNYSIDQSNISFEHTRGAEATRLDFLRNITQTNNTNLTGFPRPDINLTSGNVSVNTTNKPGWNVTANITFFGLTFTDPQVIMDFADDGTFETCGPTICTELEFTSGVIFKFNTSSFTRYSANETPVANQPPTVHNLSFPASFTPRENFKTGFNITINFTATDPNGAADLLDPSAIAYIVNNSINKNSTPVNCTAISHGGNTNSRNYSCQINITHYLPAGVWNISVNITDVAGEIGTNATEEFTLNALTAIILNVTEIQFEDVQPAKGDQRVNRTLGIDNTGNVNITTIDFKAYDVWNVTNEVPTTIINASNFTVSVHELPTGPPATLRNDTLVTLTNSTLAVDSDNGDSGNRTFYFFINVSNILPGKYNATRLWEVSVTP